MSKKWLALALKVLVSGFLLWFVLSKIDPAQAVQRVLKSDPWMFAGACAVILVQMAIGGVRWETVLRVIGAPLGFAKAIVLFYIGIFFSQFLPSAVGGDAVRMYKAYREGLGLRGAINGVMLERAVTVVALVILVVATQPWFAPRVGEAAWMVILPAVVLAAVGTAGGLAFVMALDRLPERLRRWRIIRGLGNLAHDARRVFLAPGPLVRVLAWGLLTHVNVSFGVFVLALGLDLGVTWLDCLVLVPPVLLVMTLPISVAGWGVRETAMVAAFGLIGVPEEGAAVLGFLMGLLGLAVAVPGGILWLASRERGEHVVALNPAMEGDADAPAGPAGVPDAGGKDSAVPPGRAN